MIDAPQLGALRRKRVDPLPSPAPVAAFALATSIFCLRLPVLAGRPMIVLLSFLPLAFGVYLVLLQRRTTSVPGGVLFIGLYVGTVAFSLLRAADNPLLPASGSASSEAFRWLAFAGLAAILLLFATPGYERRLCVCGVTLAAPLYVAVNAVLHLAGRENAAFPNGVYAKAKMLAFLGIDRERVVFPLASGLNNFAVIAAVALVTSTLLVMRSTGRARLAYVALTAACAYAVLLTDSRAAFAAPGVAAVAVLAAPRVSGRMMPWLVPVSPLILLAAITLGLSIGLTGLVARDPGGVSGSSSARTIIWDQGAHFLRHPSADFIFGYGAYGHFTSGLSQKYAYLFVGPTGVEKSTHNFALQTILDLGLLGLALVIALIAVAAAKLTRRLRAGGSKYIAAHLGVLLTLVLLGATESTPTIYTPEALASFVLVLLLVATMRPLGGGRRHEEAAP